MILFSNESQPNLRDNVFFYFSTNKPLVLPF